MRAMLAAAVLLLGILAGGDLASAEPQRSAEEARAQGTATGRARIEALAFGPLEFEPPTPDKHEVSGVRVLLLEDRSLPLVSVFARFRGGYGLFPREWYAPAMGLPALLRSGGSDHPMTLLQRAGVDLGRPDAVRAVVRQLDDLVSQLERAVKGNVRAGTGRHEHE